MFELLYASTAVTDFNSHNLFQLLSNARVNNKNLGVTGMLIFSDKYFAQLLEGDEDTVRNLFDTIKDDTRHTNVNKFYEGEIKSRSFSKWTMAFHAVGDSEELKQIPGFENIKAGESLINTMIGSPNKGKELFIYLRDFLLSEPDR